MFVLSTNRKGAIAETKIAAAATELDIPVLRPITEHARYDLASRSVIAFSACSANGAAYTRMAR